MCWELRGPAVAEYRAYIIGADGQFMRAIELLCPVDVTAKEYTKQLVDGHDRNIKDRVLNASWTSTLKHDL
jgi:hypothetical protein